MANTLVRPALWPKETVRDLVQQHTDASGVVVPDEVIDRIMDLTSGQPWLVNYFLKEVCFDGEVLIQVPNVDRVDRVLEGMFKNRLSHVQSLDKFFKDKKDDRIRKVHWWLKGGPNPSRDAKDLAEELHIIRIGDDGTYTWMNKVVAEVMDRLQADIHIHSDVAASIRNQCFILGQDPHWE